MPGQTPARDVVARAFDMAIKQSGWNNTQVADFLRGKLGRDTLTRQTVKSWRTGEQPVPADAAWIAFYELGGLPTLLYIREQVEARIDALSRSVPNATEAR